MYAAKPLIRSVSASGRQPALPLHLQGTYDQWGLSSPFGLSGPEKRGWADFPLPFQGNREGNIQGKFSLRREGNLLAFKATTLASWAASTFSMQSNCTRTSLRSGSGVRLRPWLTLMKMSVPSSWR
jgi:hypothetical protein